MPVRFSLGDLGPALVGHRQGELDAEEVAWIFVRERVADHTPSFSWDTAKLDRLLPLVIGCSDDPKLAATSPEELVEELARLELEERERMRRSLGQIRKSIGAMSFDWAKAFKFPTISDQLIRSMASPKFKPPPTLSDSMQRQIQALQPGVSLAETVNQQLLSIGKSLELATAVPRIEPLKIDPSLWQSVARLLDSHRSQFALNDQLVTSMATLAKGQNLAGLADELLRAAREADEEEAVEALEATAEVLRPDITPDELADAVEQKLKPSFDELEAKVDDSEESTSQKLFFIVVSAIIALALQAALGQLGVPLAPTQEDTPAEQQGDGPAQAPQSDQSKPPKRRPGEGGPKQRR